MDTNLTNSNFQEDNSHVDIKHEVKKYLRYWPWFAFAIALCFTAAYVYLRYTPRIYQTHTKIKILDESDGLELPTSAFVFKRSNINLENEIQILTSYMIIERVVRELKLNTTFQEEGQIQTSLLAELPFQFDQHIQPDSISNNFQYEILVNENDFEVLNVKSDEKISFKGHDSYSKSHNLPFDIKLNNKSTLSSIEGKKYVVRFMPMKSATLRLKSQVKIEPIGEQSDLLQLSINSESTLWSEHVLNTLVKVFNEDGINDRTQVSKRTLDFIDDRFMFLARELDSIEIDKKEFKQDNNLVYLPSDTELGLQRRAQSEDELFRIESQIALAQLVKEALNSNENSSGLLPSNVGVESGGVNELIGQYNTAVLEYEKFTGSGGGDNNPMVKQLKLTMADLRENINKTLNSYNNQLEVSRKQLDARNLRARGEVSRIPQKEKLLRAIDRQQRIKESLYLLLLQKREEAAINLAITEPSIKIVESALSGSGPISPKPNVIYAAALLGGILLPFGVLYLIFMLDTKVHDKKDIEKIVKNVPIIGQIPEVKDKAKLIFEDPNDRSILAESFRILSSNVKYVLPLKENGDGQVIFCTSTIKGEGKTYVSVNLSLALSSLNKKVLLIGSDLRNPQIHSYSNKNKNAEGLSNYLHDIDLDWKNLLIRGFKNHLTHDVLLSGSIPPNPAHLLTNGRFDELIKEAKSLYDYIIVDTAPTILVTDTMLISHLSDVNVYIVKANYTEKNLLEFSKELNESGKLKNMAYVVNSVGTSKSHGYGYNYGYGYGYNEDK
ncbi:GumC family protein [Bizionia arctica]|uniref:non-specific protein-tyrosine kinase n=1 Tax=Bizionia arctica TaxID=1495645 RepID=A0A917GX49_9FLAO|nr:tyrosine-protein kinase domain-containing protein [Bizionia arctica]GGG60237.1 tyrosine protein kinase [Bizionia arctica]